ncbi:Ig-like domain-containing protein [Streptococcus salivarius]|uniref:Ig-like domain-containing protein n=9 Tax=Streptococcus TaxID=1301 RepID=UPI0015840811|nr:Ig-like domain-containing protein [Streptococcus salivarius]
MGKDIFSKKSRFSIRKLNIGVCSVLLGTLIMIGHTAQADETTSDGATVAATALSASQGEGVPTATSPSTAPESAATATVAPAATETVTATSVAPTSSVASSVAVSSEAPASTSATSSAPASTAPASSSATSSAPASTAPASTSATSSAPASSASTSTSPVVASEVTSSTNVSTAKPATDSEASRSVTASTASSTTASSVSASANNVTVSETANVPRVRSRRAVGQERAQDRSMEGKDIKYVYQNRRATVNGGEPTQRAKIEYRQLDDYEVVNGKTVATDPSGQGRPVLEWTVTFNEAQYDRMGGYYYFTIPKNVSDPYNVVTDYNGAYVDRDGWKDANKESGAGSANAEGVQYVDAGNKLEWRVKNTVGSDYNNVDGLSGVMGDTKKVYVLQLSNSSSARKFTIKYRTIVEDSSQVISYIAGVESKTGLPRNNWYAISGKYDKNLVSQVGAPSVTPNLTNTSINVPVQTVASTSSTLSGTGVPGATIKLYIDGQEQNIGNVTVDSSGNWTTGELPTALNNNQGEGTTIKPRQTVQVTQTVDGTESSRRTVPVSIGETTVEPSSLTSNQDAVVAGQKEVTLKVPHDAGIAYLRYTDTAGQTVEVPVKRDSLSAAWVSQKSDKATVKSYEQGKFQDTIVLTMADKIAGTEVSSISNVVEGGFSSVAGWQPRSVENQAPTITSAVEGNRKTVEQGAQLDLASLVTVADKEDDAQATLGDKVHAEVVSVNGNTATKTVDTNTQGTYTVKYKAVDSQGKESGEIEVTVVVNPARQNEAPTVEIPYSNKDTKEVYVYGGEENSFDIKFKDDSGKIASATVKQGGNREFDPVTGEADTINTQYGFKANVISTETPATADAPAVITYRGTPAATDGLTQDRLTAATKGENPAGLPLGWRYATATDTDGALIENKAVGSSTATDPGAFRVVLKPQNQKYDVATPTEKVTVADPANVTEAELAKIKEKVQLEYSQNNDDANLADKKGTPADKTNKIQSVTKDADGNLVVTYADGSIDKKPLSEFVNVAPTVEIPYSNKDTKEVYVYGGEENSFDIKFKDDSGKIASATVKQGGNREFDPVTGEADTINTQYGFKANVITTETPATADAPAVITYRGTPAATDGLTQDRLTAATKGENPAGLPLGWRYATATDTDGALVENKAVGSSTATDPGAFRVVLKPQNQKYDVATPTEKVEVANPDNVTNDELNKIKEKLQLEYSQTNDDANLADKKGTTVADKTNKIQSVTKDADGNLVVTYTDGSTDKKPLSEFVTKDTTAPAKPEVKTDLTGKAGTKDPVEVSAEPGSTVELFDKDGNSLGAAVANDQGVATITPTKDIPEGNVTVKATDAAGNVSVPSDPAKATDTTAPAAPVVNTVKAGDTAVTGTAEAGSTVEVTLPDGSKVSATADQDGNYSVPVSGLNEGDTISVTATDEAGNKSDATTATVAKADDKTAPLAPVVNTVKAGDTAVTGTAEAGSTVEVTLPDGSKVSATADQDGNFSVPVSGLNEGATVSVTATDKAGNTSNPTSVTVGKGTDTTAPTAPVVNPVKAGDTAVTGTAEAGSTVEVTLPDGSKVSAKADKEGNFSVPVSGLNEGATVSVTATDEAGNTSRPTSVTVGKGIDTTAPSAPVVNTDLTGKAGTRTPIDVIAEPGSTVALYDKDGNKIGEATADENGKATITPTVDLPEGNVTAKATDLAGNVSEASAPMLATRGGSTDTFNNGKGSDVAQTTVKPSPVVDVQAVDSSDKHTNLKARASISAAQKDTSTLPATGEEASTAAVVLGGVLAAFGLTLAGKRKKED